MQIRMQRHATTLMIQGTTSDAGKTTLVAGLGRLFARKGISVAPFKSQNMALNSAVTQDGLEIGRSQALQAYACGIEPDVDMNPILLKPNSDTGAQVIVHGKALHNLEAVAYHRYKPQALEAALQSHARLAEKYDLILAEGAGSPAEINLREGDVANMGFAEAADCPVILVADIDRGGVFAHLVGTLDLLSTSEQNRIVGFIINRFRGDMALLQNGLDWLEEKTGKPVLAVLPYLQGLQLDAEDGIDVDQDTSSSASNVQPHMHFNIKVPVFPRISNHTDFDALRMHPQINLTFVGPGGSLEDADLIILPGSKSVRADLAWLREEGYDQQIQKHLRYGGKLLGVCGGFQMLGEKIDDPHGIEGEPGSSLGLGYFEMQTRLAEEKTLKQANGHLLLLDQAKVSGYEIHCGETQGGALSSPLMMLDTQPEGAISADDLIAGTYLHGLFDTADALHAFMAWAGLTTTDVIDRKNERDKSLDKLANCIDANMNWHKYEQALSAWQKKPQTSPA